ncbi:hypothetical protein ABZ345_39395 [Lentzea sp. NPDC005914]|uniref:hypothetical protein n=1 Tax=Lentzea sp. NPDC005914 TaxID=3154572 RepID=UPI0033C63469
MIRSVLAAAALVLATATPASAEPTGYLIWDSDKDSSPTHGSSGSWTPPSLFSVREDPEKGNLIRIKGESPDERDYIMIELARHDGQRIGEGDFADERVHVVYHGLGSWDEGGDFAVEHIAFNAEGLISEFDGAAEHHNGDRPDSTFRAKVSYRR